MDTIDSIQHDIRAWRRRQPRGALPAALRGRILALGSQLDRPGAHRALGVHPSTLYRWREQARSSKAFVEIQPLRRRNTENIESTDRHARDPPKCCPDPAASTGTQRPALPPSP